jgi:hypothetical protein
MSTVLSRVVVLTAPLGHSVEQMTSTPVVVVVAMNSESRMDSLAEERSPGSSSKRGSSSKSVSTQEGSCDSWMNVAMATGLE